MKIIGVNVQPTAENCHSQESTSNLINPRKSSLILLLLFKIAKYSLLPKQLEENIENPGKIILVFSPQKWRQLMLYHEKPISLLWKNCA